MSALKHVRLLLVEDDPEDAQIFRRYVSRVRFHSVELVHVTDAEQALAALQDRPFDCACVDLNLGGASGLDLLRSASTLPDCPPIIIVTGSGDEEKAAETMRSGAADYLVKDHLSAPLLDRAFRTVLEKQALQRERDNMMRRLAWLSVTDELTSLANRRHLMTRLDDELARSERTGRPFALLLIDIDGFKAVNDEHGHQTGDGVLRACARTIASAVRKTDFVARHGGDEFCVLLIDTNGENRAAMAERICAAVEKLPGPVPTVSIGATAYEPGVTRDALFRAADEALYEAKSRGRNTVAVRDPAAPVPAADR
ncbi:MAG: diguanylate cyclase [Planctomycetota bacterium]